MHRTTLADVYARHLREVRDGASSPTEDALALALSATGAEMPADQGWVLESGAAEVIGPFVKRLPQARHQTAEFTGLDTPAAVALLARIPAKHLETRENDSPTVGAFLRATVEHPEHVRPFGYVVGPGRPDERIAVTGARVYGLPGIRPKVDDSVHPDETWEMLRRELKLDALAPPDDLRRRPVLLPSRHPCWVLWWD